MQTHIEVTKRYEQGKMMEINGGTACFSGFDSYLSQVVGWGFKTPLNHYQADILKIEQFYQALQHTRVDIEFCPFVGQELAEFLSQRGYMVSELNNVSALNLADYKPVPVSDELLIKQLSPAELDDWAFKMAEGFDYPPAIEQFSHFARAKNIMVFGVYSQNELVAGATMAMHGPCCDLGVTSTLPRYRGQGLQKKLLWTRLNVAKASGLTIATVTTEAGTISDLNIQKVGFHCAYTRIKFTKLAI